MKIKEENNEMGYELESYKDTDIIKSIKITKLKTINNLDLISDKIRELLGSDSFQF